MCTFNILLSWRFPRKKQRFCTILLSAPTPNPFKSAFFLHPGAPKLQVLKVPRTCYFELGSTHHSSVNLWIRSCPPNEITMSELASDFVQKDSETVVALNQITIRHIIITRTFLVLRIIFPIKTRVILYTKFHPHYSQIVIRNYFPLRVVAFFMRNLNLWITHFGVTHPNCFGTLISGRITHNNPNNYTKILLGI